MKLVMHKRLYYYPLRLLHKPFPQPLAPTRVSLYTYPKASFLRLFQVKQLNEGVATMALHEWDPDKVQQAIDADLHLNMDEDGNTLSYEQLAKDRLRENVPFAVSVLAHIMQYSDNENLRAKVAQYMVDRVIGRVSDQPLFTSGSDDPLMRIMEEVTSRGAN